MDEIIDLTDVTQICRICLKQKDDLSPLDTVMKFEEKGYPSINVLQALVSLTSIPVEVGPNLPSNICWKCLELTKSAFLFKSKYEKSVSILKIVTSNVFKINKVASDYQQKVCNIQKSSSVQQKNQVLQEILQQQASEQNGENLLSPSCEPANESNEEYEQEQNESLKTECNDTIEEKPKLHPCPICVVELPALELREHIHSHRSLKSYLSVPKVSPNARFFTNPKSSRFVQQKNRLHTCPKCDENISASEFQQHIQSRHRFENKFSCDKCDRTFDRVNYLNIHRLTHMKEYPFQCKECNRGFVVKKNYECHLLKHRDILLHSCEFCSKRFSNPEHLHRHRTVHTENMTYGNKYKSKRCRKCLLVFDKDNVRGNHDCNANMVTCRFCSKVFKNISSMYSHLQAVHRKKKGLCSICGVKSKNIAIHMRLHTKSQKQKSQYMRGLCSICGIYVANIYNHMARHNNSRIHKCTQCSRAFCTRQGLIKHQKTHTGAKPYMCSVCGKSFNNSYNLQVHERIHEGNKCHVCTVCNKGFLEKSYLKKHMLVHADLDKKKKSKPDPIDLLMKMGIKDEMASKLEFYEM
ncbi:uncharacterized protein isoform X2 [Leptinotarsa decemlineata]|uniref:uncharacterized protein isoform X2 n=1 Tax=Leptinotarsa decemlineata TaxID=7539 RepID=UPI003D30AC29